MILCVSKLSGGVEGVKKGQFWVSGWWFHFFLLVEFVVLCCISVVFYDDYFCGVLSWFFLNLGGIVKYVVKL